MKRFLFTFSTLLVFPFILFGVSIAQHQHGVSTSTPMKMESKEILVEGIKISFQVMPNAEHMKMLSEMKMKEKPETETTHNITVVLVDSQTQKEITDAQVKMKVIDPSGKDKIKTLKTAKEMSSYDGYFNLAEKGKYQVLVSFKIGNKIRNAGIYYDVK